MPEETVKLLLWLKCPDRAGMRENGTKGTFKLTGRLYRVRVIHGSLETVETAEGEEENGDLAKIVTPPMEARAG